MNFSIRDPNNYIFGGEKRKHPRLKNVYLPQRNINLGHLKLMSSLIKKLMKCNVFAPSMILHMTNAAIIMCTHGVANAKTLRGSVIPISLYFLLLAESSAGKSGLESLLFKAMLEVEDELVDMKMPPIDFDESEETDRPMAMLDDLTLPALVSNIEKLKIIMIKTTEASKNLLNAKPELTTALNQLVDAECVRISRGGTNGRNIKLENVRLSMYLGLQLNTMLDFIGSSKGRFWFNVGAGNRFLVSVAEADFTARPSNIDITATDEYKVFKDRQEYLLRLSYSPGYVRTVEQLSPEAAELFEQMCFEIRAMCAEGQYFSSVAAHVTKAQDMILKLAVGFHVFEGFEGDVSKETLQTAYETVMYFADHFVSVFTEIPQCELDANEMQQYIEVLRSSTGSSMYTPEQRYIYLEKFRSQLPSHLARKGRFEDALRVLHVTGFVQVYNGTTPNSPRSKRFIDLYPNNDTYLPAWLNLLGPAL